MRLNKTRARKNTEEWTIIMASDFWLIAGLGNPGSKYEGTRHNMGFMTADVLAERWSVNFSDHKGLAMLGKGVMNLSGRNVKFFLAKPLTYMNESGNAVASISAYYQIEPDHIVVIHDDMDLDFGRIKVKAGGSAGGHNGIKSIDRSLGTPKYARVRMGVGHAQRGAHAHDNTVNWVLGGFGPDQRKQLPEFLADGADAAETIIFDGGRIKVKAGGSAGGHNGIKSIDRSLGTPKYARVRMGVGHAQRGAHAHDNTVNWVLGGFGPDQRKQLPEFLADGADAAETIIFDGLAKAQERFNGR